MHGHLNVKMWHTLYTSLYKKCLNICNPNFYGRLYENLPEHRTRSLFKSASHFYINTVLLNSIRLDKSTRLIFYFVGSRNTVRGNSHDYFAWNWKEKRNILSSASHRSISKPESNRNPSNETVDLWQPYVIPFQTSAWIMGIDTPSGCTAVSTVQVCVYMCVCVCVFYKVFNSSITLRMTV